MLPILSTKFHIPRAHPNRVQRTHLIEKLEEGLWCTPGVDFTRRLTLVAAPAGYGKTTQLCEWIDHLKIPAAWITFDEADNDLGRFLQYLIASLQTISPGIGETTLAGFQVPQFTTTQPGISSAMSTLVNEIAAIPRPFILVFDDYHTLEDKAVHQAVMFLLDHMPEKLSLVIATRADPHLPLSRLRTRRQLVELRSDDLRFSEREADTFLRQVMHLNLQDTETATLAERTEGWIAGLQMAALALQERADTAGFIREFSGRDRFVIDYLFEEVLNRQPNYIQDFLIQTSILERLSGPLCDAVLGKQEVVDASLHLASVPLPDSGQQILEYLEHANLFLVPLDDERCYYRYHHLFTDLLRHRLHRSFPDHISGLHSRAAECFELQGNISEALDHWIAARNFNKAANLIAKNGYKYLEQGNLQQMLNWLQQIPEDFVRSQPRLCIFYSWSLIFMGQFSEGEDYLSCAEKILPPIGETTDRDILEQFGHVAAVREYLASRSQDVNGIIQYADLALKNVATDDISIRSIITLLLGHGRLLSDQFDLAQTAYLEAAHLGKDAGYPLIIVIALCNLANLMQSRGELHDAFDAYQEAAKFAIDERGWSLPVAAEVYEGRARLYYEWNDLKTAEENLLLAREIGMFYLNFDSIVDSVTTLSRLWLAQNNLEAAEHLLKEVEQSDRQASLIPGIAFLANQLNFYLAKGDLARATRLTAKQDWRLENKCFFAWSEAFIAYTKFLITQNQYNEAHDLLNQCLSKVQAAGLWQYVIKVLIIQASLLNIQGDHSLTQAKLERALSLAEPEGFIRIFVDEGEPVRSLLKNYRMQIAQKSRAGDPASLRLLTYVDKLLSAFPGIVPDQTITPPTVSYAPPVLVDPLTDRELEILRLINAGLSNKEIAEKLVISVGTVKAHTYSIYRKLDVEGRTKALAKAREIHLL